MLPDKISCEAAQRSRITPEITERLESLFEFAPPNELREYLIEIFHAYISHEHQSLPYNFKEMTESLRILMDLLKFADHEFREQTSRDT